MKKFLIPLLLLAWIGLGTMNAQTITGVVTGEQDKEPLAGVAVMVKNSTTGTFTDNNGYYSVTVPSLDATLIFLFVGMNTIEVPVNNRTVINVSMVAQVLSLDEVFVTAYGTAKRESFTGSASVVKTTDLQKVSTISVTNALQGTTSGIQVNNVSSQPGNSPQIRIRGISSINGSSDPLYVVNGAPFGGDLNSIDINDVESVSVLKDASATALYGSRASAGVILITTRKGFEGKPVFTVKLTQGVNNLALPLMKRVNNAQYYEMRWEAGKNGYLDRYPSATLAQAEAYATSTLLPKLGNYNSFDRFPLLANGKIDPAAKPRWGSGPTDYERWYCR
jgi:TonB-dependent SusC/RagA subfamily outer membrane receptor